MAQVPAAGETATKGTPHEPRAAEPIVAFSLAGACEAARLFAGAAVVAFVLIVVVTTVAPDFGRSVVAALERFYYAPANLVRKYIDIFFVIVIGNSLAAAASSTLGAVGAIALARVGQSSQERPRDYGAMGRASYRVMDLLCRLAAAFVPALSRARDPAARGAAAVAVLAPRLSLVCSGAVLGIYLAAALTTGWLEALWAAVIDLVPHAAFEVPAAWMAAAIGIAVSDRLVAAATRGPSALRRGARAFLASSPYARAVGIVLALIFIAAAMEVRGLQ